MTNYQQAINELSTIRDLIRWGASQFNHADLTFGHGCDNAWDEALALTLHVLALPHEIDADVLNAHLTSNERAAIVQLFQRRIEEKLPTAYLTNRATFAGIEFYVDNRVLIPRSPIAELIENHFAPWIEYHQVQNILDLCTGSGCIAAAIAYAFPEATVEAADISTEALEVAKTNIEQLQLEQQVKLIHSDLFEGLKNKQYDIIVTNPPYVDQGEMQNLAMEYRHEPALGLAAGEQGLDVAIKILQQAVNHLTAHGILVMEVGNSQAALIEQYPQVPFIWLEFSRGGQGVFLLSAKELTEYFKV